MMACIDCGECMTDSPDFRCQNCGGRPSNCIVCGTGRRWWIGERCPFGHAAVGTPNQYAERRARAMRRRWNSALDWFGPGLLGEAAGESRWMVACNNYLGAIRGIE